MLQFTFSGEQRAMSEAFFQRSVNLGRRYRAYRARSLPRGYGLLVGAVLSLGLWGAVIWGVWRLIV